MSVASIYMKIHWFLGYMYHKYLQNSKFCPFVEVRMCGEGECFIGIVKQRKQFSKAQVTRLILLG